MMVNKQTTLAMADPMITTESELPAHESDAVT